MLRSILESAEFGERNRHQSRPATAVDQSNPLGDRSGTSHTATVDRTSGRARLMPDRQRSEPAPERRRDPRPLRVRDRDLLHRRGEFDGATRGHGREWHGEPERERPHHLREQRSAFPVRALLPRRRRGLHDLRRRSPVREWALRPGAARDRHRRDRLGERPPRPVRRPVHGRPRHRRSVRDLALPVLVATPSADPRG